MFFQFEKHVDETLKHFKVKSCKILNPIISFYRLTTHDIESKNTKGKQSIKAHM